MRQGAPPWLWGHWVRRSAGRPASLGPVWMEPARSGEEERLRGRASSLQPAAPCSLSQCAKVSVVCLPAVLMRPFLCSRSGSNGGCARGAGALALVVPEAPPHPRPTPRRRPTLSGGISAAAPRRSAAFRLPIPRRAPSRGDAAYAPRTPATAGAGRRDSDDGRGGEGAGLEAVGRNPTPCAAPPALAPGMAPGSRCHTPVWHTEHGAGSSRFSGVGETTCGTRGPGEGRGGRSRWVRPARWPNSRRAVLDRGPGGGSGRAPMLLEGGCLLSARRNVGETGSPPTSRGLQRRVATAQDPCERCPSARERWERFPTTISQPPMRKTEFKFSPRR